jgi:hypothetical protein
MDIDTEWENFISFSNSNNTVNDDFIENESSDEEFLSANISSDIDISKIEEAPIASNIYISTKTKIAYINHHIDLHKIFWEIPIIPYEKPTNGIIKKQMKFNSFNYEDFQIVQDKIKMETNYCQQHIITHIDNPCGRIKFKDTRKISIGISKKDLISFRCKKKSAFYNCFVLILRIKIEDSFKEFHVKVFNTGKLEIPGIQCDIVFDKILERILSILQTYSPENKLKYNENSNETVLINSNFNCGFFINREILYDILKNKYNIQTIYDPCSYPGIQCKFYYNKDVEIQDGCQISEKNKDLYKNTKDISFMIFRTGSVLIVGKCDLNVLIIIYEYLKNILRIEFKNICQKNIVSENTLINNKDKKKKLRKKTITIEKIAIS